MARLDPGGVTMPARRAAGALLLLSLVLAAVRLLAAWRVGFGDSEALYASWALHPQPAYLDHPGLVGVIASVVGGGTAPRPLAAHLLTTLLATAWPLLLALAARAAGASWERCFVVAVVGAVVPEMAIGLFALTPDLLLALGWTGSLGAAALGLRSAPGSARATASFAAAGLLAGISTGAKVSGLGLMAALAVTYASRPARPHGRTVAPWAGLTAGAVVLAPIAAFEAHTGWPMLRHRLVETQASAGLSLRNVGAVLGGQVLYLSPVVVLLVVKAARDAWRERDDAVGRLLLYAFVVPLVPLLALSLWSRVAEPHWISPALLSLAVAAARSPTSKCSPRLVGAAIAVAGVMVAAVHAWVLVPASVRLTPRDADPRLDLSNELVGWPDVLAAVSEEAAAASNPLSQQGDVSVVGPHWVICAQLEAGLRGRWPVGCDTPVPDDFDGWWPRSRWRQSDFVVWVSDARFGREPPSSLLSSHVPLRTRNVDVERGGRTVRHFAITVLSSRSSASLP